MSREPDWVVQKCNNLTKVNRNIHDLDSDDEYTDECTVTYFQVLYKNQLVGETKQYCGGYTLFYLNGEEDWELVEERFKGKYGLQQMLFYIKQRMESEFRRIEYVMYD